MKECMRRLLVLTLFCLGFSLAQSTSWLVGDWQAQVNGAKIEFSFRQDASYTSKIITADEELDEGTWSLNGNILTIESYEYEAIDYTLEQLSESTFNLSGGDLEVTLNFSRVQNAQNPLTTQTENPLTKPTSSSTTQDWFLGEWNTVNGIQLITLRNNADGTYTFDIEDILNPYHEEGTWTLEGNQFTQKWKDATTGQDTQATYIIEKLSDNSFNQSGGNLEDTVFSFTRAGGDPLANLEDILTQPEPTETQNPLDPSTPSNPLDETTPVDQTVATEPQAPPPAVDPTVTQDFILGDWIARERDAIYTFNVRKDTYTWQISKWNGEVIYSEEAQWAMENGRLKQVWQNKQTGLTETSYYEPEKVSENALRMRGGNFGLKTFLFHRVLPNQISPLSSWLVGYWDGFIGIDSWGFTFQADGSYTLEITPFDGEIQTLRGMWTLEHEKLTLSGDKAVTYDLSYTNDFSIYIFGEDLGDSTNLFQRVNQDLTDPYQIPTFVGQYIQEDNTLTITYDGTQYGGSWLQKDQLYTLAKAKIEKGLLTFMAVGIDGKEYPHTFKLMNNGLQEQSDSFSFNPHFQKISETTLPTADELMSYWIQTEGFSQDDDLLLLPDGRYRQSSYFELVGEVSHSVTEGLYKLGNNQLILDPSCSGPSTYSVTQVQNHLLESFNYADRDVVTTYMSAPATSVDYQLAQVKLRDEIEAQINAEWEQKIALAPINTSIGRIPPSGEISADPFPEDIFANSMVFAEQELYPYTSDYYYVYDTGGNYIQTSLNSQIIGNMNPGGFKQDIDFSRGSYYDKLNRYFFPNGRTLQYYESYSTATSIAYPPKPTISYSWSKYKIEDGKIIVGDDANPVVYELIDGRRHIRFEEECFENLDFSVSTIKQ
jgi:hypothetical protein